MRYCYHCMHELLNENARFCPKCGKSQEVDAELHQLSPGTVLREKYLLGAVLGEGGFGITYIGRDLTLDIRVAIKEFYPNGFVNRVGTASPNVTCSKEENKQAFFQKGKTRFLQEARVLAKFAGEPGIVDVRDFFEENGTAYIVMEFVDGINLRDYLKQNGKQTPEETLRLLTPVMESLKLLHNENLIHRDISPDNIMLAGNKVKLLDFGAARSVGDDQKSLSVMLKPGYAPEEQYRTHGKQGPWTDVYALCATIYRCMTGVRPEPSNDRIWEDHLQPPSALGVEITPQFEQTLMRGLAVRVEDRVQSIDELLAGLRGSETPAADVPEKPQPEKRSEPEIKSEPEKTPAPEKSIKPEEQPQPAVPVPSAQPVRAVPQTDAQAQFSAAQPPVYSQVPLQPQSIAPQPQYTGPVYSQPVNYTWMPQQQPVYYAPAPVKPPEMNAAQTLVMRIALLAPYVFPAVFLVLQIFTLLGILTDSFPLGLKDYLLPILSDLVLLGLAAVFYRPQLKTMCVTFTLFSIFLSYMAIPVLNSAQKLYSGTNRSFFDYYGDAPTFMVFNTIALVFLLVVLLPVSIGAGNKAKKIYIRLFPQCLLLNLSYYLGILAHRTVFPIIPALVLLGMAVIMAVRIPLQMADPAKRAQYKQTLELEIPYASAAVGARAALLVFTLILFVCAIVFSPVYAA